MAGKNEDLMGWAFSTYVCLLESYTIFDQVIWYIFWDNNFRMAFKEMCFEVVNRIQMA
jgi:hypothetical protein